MNTKNLWLFPSFQIFKEIPLTSKLLFNQKNFSSLKMQQLLFAMITLILISSTYAGPLHVHVRHKRMMRDIFTDFSSEPHNNTESDNKCILNGLQVPQSTVECEKKNGCRAIQKTGYCCPDYQCECEHNGKVYENGQKLAIDSSLPCRVCHCQGGEIICNSVTCYKRNDCEPKYIQGICCPQYDNCPPLDELSSTTTRKNLVFQNNYNTSLPISSTTVSSITLSTLIPPPKELSNNPLGIKIKEITKPEEIRIVDEKPKIVYQIQKPNGNSGSNQTKFLQPTEDGKAFFSSTESLLSADNLNLNFPNNINDVDTIDNDEILNGESLKTIRQTENLDNSAENNSNLSNESSNHEILQHGGEVVIVDRNGQSKPFLIQGIEGLQRGDLTEELNNTEIKEESHNVDDMDDCKSNFSSSDVTSSDVELEAAGSEVDIHVSHVKPDSINKINSKSSEEISISSTPKEEIFETILYTSSPHETFEEKEDEGKTELPFETVFHEVVSESLPPYSSTTEGIIPSSSVNSQLNDFHDSHAEDDDTILNEWNPAYPKFPEEDFSIYGRVMFTQSDAEDIIETSHKSKSAMQIDEFKKSTTEGPNDLEQLLIQKSSTELSTNIIDTDVTTSEYDLIKNLDESSEWEKNSTELINYNQTDNLTTNDEWQKQVSVEVDSGSGSGFGQILDNISLKRNETVEFDDETEASADAPINLEILNDQHSLENSVTSGTSDVLENNHEDHFYDSDQQPFTNYKLLRAFEALYNFRKSFPNLF